MYRGIPVLGASAIAHLDAQDRCLEPTARLFAGIDIAPVPLLDEAAIRARVAGIRRLQLVIVPDRVFVFNDTERRIAESR